ncbi:MAG: ral secretion pathway protein [Sphingomonadales bacterium]|jgi:general secretion pathway protein D|nr:ral secretion pathway protein [Sphingomonadales bacterium]
MIRSFGPTPFARLLAFFLLLLAFGAAPAAAQSPSVLSKVTLLSDSPAETRLQLSIEPSAHGFAPVGNDVNRPALGLALTIRGGGATTPPNLKGLVRGISFEQVETILILRFQVTSAASVSATASGPTTIDVTVSTGAPAVKVEAEEPGTVASDVPPSLGYAPGETFELVQLKYADVSEIVGLLSQGASVKSNDLFVPREPAFGSNSLTGNTYNPGPTTQSPGSDDSPLGQSIDAGMAVDRRLNAVWLRGSPEYIARMKLMIAAIDVPLDSVVLETQFVELTETGAKAVGIDFANSNGQIAVITGQAGQFIPPGFGRGDAPRLFSAQIQAAIYAQVQKGNGRIVSKPRIAAQSGSTAKIITGDALPILTAITLSGVNGVSQQVQYVNVGVTLQIAPRVSSDGYVSSHVFCVVSSVTGFSQGYPTISQREAETSATVKDGDSFIIGGLSQEDSIRTRSKIPGLGDIPLLGQAFSTNRKTQSKTELYIVITPHIIHRVDEIREHALTIVPTTTTTVTLRPDGTPVGEPPQ